MHHHHHGPQETHHHGSPTGDPRRIAAMWPWVRDQLAGTSGPVLEVGCGPIGGFVPTLVADGREALGVDPVAPDGPHYLRSGVEELAADASFGAVVASASLHHVADLPALADRLAALLQPGGRVVVVEWAWERIDAATAQWCFDRLPDDGGDSWLSRQRTEWRDSGLPWVRFVADWAAAEAPLHPGAEVVRVLAARFRTVVEQDVPYFHPYLSVDAATEQAAADAGEINLAGIRWVGVLDEEARAR